MAKQRLPIELTDRDVAFGSKWREIMPPMSEIPDDFERTNSEWVQWQQDWFFKGLERYPVPREGIDLRLAMKNLACVQGSWSPKHEHKQAGVAYLASLWFTSPDGEPIKKSA